MSSYAQHFHRFIPGETVRTATICLLIEKHWPKQIPHYKELQAAFGMSQSNAVRWVRTIARERGVTTRTTEDRKLKSARQKDPSRVATAKVGWVKRRAKGLAVGGNE